MNVMELPAAPWASAQAERPDVAESGERPGRPTAPGSRGQRLLAELSEGTAPMPPAPSPVVRATPTRAAYNRD